jgi:hypothetical protein
LDYAGFNVESFQGICVVPEHENGPTDDDQRCAADWAGGREIRRRGTIGCQHGR